MAVDYLSRSLTIFEEIADPIGGAANLAILGRISFNKGDLNKALAYSKKSLSTKAIPNFIKHNSYSVLGDVYYMKGELDRALRYYKRVSSFAEKMNFYPGFINHQILIGLIYVAKREYGLAIEILKSGLILAKEINFPYNTLPITNSLLG